MRRLTALLLGAGIAAALAAPTRAAETVMQQCGQQYQAAKAGGTLNGMSWGQYRTECAARLKAQPASAPVAAPEPPATTVAVPAPAGTVAGAAAPAALPPASTAAPGKPPATGGRAAMLTRQKQCGAEWRAQKVSLVAQTPGLTWPKYWSQCNTKLKAAGQ